MKVGVLGTGAVGATVANKLIELGHEVTMGAREAGGDRATAWVDASGERAAQSDFAGAAEAGEVVFNATAGSGAVAAVSAAGEALAGKLLIDVSNPLEFHDEGPPTLFVGNDDSLGEQVQAAVPAALVVKSLNTVTADVMVDPGRVPGDHVIFVAGDDASAKQRTTEILGEFGWPAERVIDVGDITGARATESYLHIWLRLMGAVGNPHFNIAVLRAG